jgi:hypothetical protein
MFPNKRTENHVRPEFFAYRNILFKKFNGETTAQSIILPQRHKKSKELRILKR